jgi:ferric-dicitrate binding protein FerR (iron transport regulator)
VVYQKDGEVGGVFDAGDKDKALQFVEQYLQGEIR